MFQQMVLVQCTLQCWKKSEHNRWEQGAQKRPQWLFQMPLRWTQGGSRSTLHSKKLGPWGLYLFQFWVQFFFIEIPRSEIKASFSFWVPKKSARWFKGDPSTQPDGLRSPQCPAEATSGKSCDNSPEWTIACTPNVRLPMVFICIYGVQPWDSWG